MNSVLPLILASSSPYRRQLLQRLGVTFEYLGPNIDESPLPGETPADTVVRLAAAKALAVAATKGPALVLGADQVATLDGRVLGKPGTEARARQQLRAVRGRTVSFLTAICLLHDGAEFRSDLFSCAVHFRDFCDAAMNRYLAQANPLDCTAAFKSEALGIALVDHMECADPTGLMGLPLTRVAAMLRSAGVPVP